MLIAGQELRDYAVMRLSMQKRGRVKPDEFWGLDGRNDEARVNLIKKLTPQNALKIQLEVKEWHHQKTKVPTVSACSYVSL